MRERTGGVAAGALVGYLLYGAAATVLFVYWHFPFDRLEQWGVAKIAQTASLRVVPHERYVRFHCYCCGTVSGWWEFKGARTRCCKASTCRLIWLSSLC